MVKELVCSDCGCEDVKILTKNKMKEKKASLIFLCLVGLVILILIFSMFITVAMFISISENDLSDIVNYFADMKWVFILNIIGLFMSLILITGCPNHKIRHELRAFRRSEVTLSFELERVLDRNIGIGSPEAALGRAPASPPVRPGERVCLFYKKVSVSFAGTNLYI